MTVPDDDVKQPPIVVVQVRLSQELRDRIDRYREALTMRPSRSQTIGFLTVNAMNILRED